MSQKTRYTLTAAIGDKLAGSTIELADEQAANPLYASRIVKAVSGGEKSLDVEALRQEIREQILDEMEQSIPPFLADATAKGQKLKEDGQAEYDRLVSEGQTKAAAVESEAKAAAAKALEDAQAKADGIIEAAKLQAEALTKAATKK